MLAGLVQAYESVQTSTSVVESVPFVEEVFALWNPGMGGAMCNPVVPYDFCPGEVSMAQVRNHSGLRSCCNARSMSQLRCSMLLRPMLYNAFMHFAHLAAHLAVMVRPSLP